MKIINADHNVERLWIGRFTPNRGRVGLLDRQLAMNESPLRTTVTPARSEGRTRANGNGPLTIPAPQNRREVDASMPTPERVTHPASISSQQTPPTEPVRLRDCFADVLAELRANEED